MLGSLSQPSALGVSSSSNGLGDEAENQANTDTELPCRYHEEQQGFQLAGWRLPTHYVLDADELQNWLLALPNWQRIKGVVHTSDGWLQLNFNPGSITTKTVGAQNDSRLEVILQSDSTINTTIEKIETAYHAESSSNSIDWEAFDRELMAMVIQSL